MGSSESSESSRKIYQNLKTEMGEKTNEGRVIQHGVVPQLSVTVPQVPANKEVEPKEDPVPSEIVETVSVHKQAYKLQLKKVQWFDLMQLHIQRVQETQALAQRLEQIRAEVIAMQKGI